MQYVQLLYLILKLSPTAQALQFTTNATQRVDKVFYYASSLMVSHTKARCYYVQIAQRRVGLSQMLVALLDHFSPQT